MSQKSSPSIDFIKNSFGTSLSYDQITADWEHFSSHEQDQINQIILQKQQNFWEKYAKFYTYFFPKLPFVPDHIKHFVDIINPQQNEVLLDLGCGYGRLIVQILKRCESIKQIIGIDFAKNMLQEAKKIISSNYSSKVILIQKNITDTLPVENGSIDCVFSNWGIFYSAPQLLEKKILPEIKRVLKPGGKFIVSTIIRGSDLPGLRKKMGFFQMIKILPVVTQAIRFGKDIKKYFPTYSAEEMIAMLKKIDFQVLNTEKTLLGNSVTIVSKLNK